MVLEDSIEENKKNEEEIKLVGVVDELAVIYNSIEEASKLNKIAELNTSQKADLEMNTASTRNSTNMIEELDKIAELEASKQADLEKKRASSTDENNLPRGKNSLSVIAARAAKKNEGNDLPGGETTDSEDPESPPKKKTGDQIDMSPITLEEKKSLEK